MKKPAPRTRKANTRAESLRDQLSTIIQRNHVARSTSDQTAREIVQLLMTLPPKQVFLGLCADSCDDR